LASLSASLKPALNLGHLVLSGRDLVVQIDLLCVAALL